MPKPTQSWETFSPQDAKDALATNEVNRTLRKSVVEKYAREMKNEDWGLCTNPIVFDEEGKLIDGQHRLTAQAHLGIDVEWSVMRGVPRTNQKNMDAQTPRTVADTLHFAGEPNAALLAAITRNVFRILNGTMSGGTTITANEVLRVLEEHPEIRHSLEQALQTKGRSMTPIAPSVMGAAHWMIAQVNGTADADIFIWRVSHLTGEKDGSPVLALNRRCNEIKRQGQKVQHRDYLAMLIKTWNLDAQGRTAVKIGTYSRTGQYVLPDVRKREVPLVDVYGQEASEDHAYGEGQDNGSKKAS